MHTVSYSLTDLVSYHLQVHRRMIWSSADPDFYVAQENGDGRNLVINTHECEQNVKTAIDQERRVVESTKAVTADPVV